MATKRKPGARRGRPPGTTRVPEGEKVVKQAVSMRPRHIATAKRLGGGNISKGVQAALDAMEVDDAKR